MYPCVALPVRACPFYMTSSSLGIAIGNGAQDPSQLSDHGELFYHLSFFDEEERDYFREQTDLVVSLVAQEKWLEALEVSLIYVQFTVYG